MEERERRKMAAAATKRVSIEAGTHEKKHVTLSLQALQEHDKSHGHGEHPRARRGTVTSSSYKSPDDPVDQQDLTDLAAGTGRQSLASLYGIDLSMRALNITKRLSLSSYTFTNSDLAQLEKLRRKHDSSLMENTYKMAAEEDEEFRPSAVKKVISDTLAFHLKDVSYKSEDCALLTGFLSNAIKDRVKQLDMPRFKIVCHVILGERKGQGVTSSSRCLWHSDTDTYATASYANETLFAEATVFGVYFE